MNFPGCGLGLNSNRNSPLKLPRMNALLSAPAPKSSLPFHCSQSYPFVVKQGLSLLTYPPLRSKFEPKYLPQNPQPRSLTALLKNDSVPTIAPSGVLAYVDEFSGEKPLQQFQI
jgi:hypothetical protein